MRASADIMNQCHCPLIQLLLVKILVFDRVEIHKVAEIGAGIPSSVVGIHVDFSELLDHLILICGICFCSRRGCSKI